MKVEFLKEKAEGFLRDADFDISEGRWFGAAFHLEQVSQLYLKYFLFKKLRDFPKTHSLRKLLDAIGKAYNKEKEIKKFLDENKIVIKDLEEAYLTSRYLPVDFEKEEVLAMKRFVKKLISFLKKL